MTKKLNVAVICGGRSAEHEVSLASAKNIVSALDRDRYAVHLLIIDREGHLLASGSPDRLLGSARSGRELGLASGAGVLSVPVEIGEEPVAITLVESNAAVISLQNSQRSPTTTIDVVFPVMHGPGGEDGSIQGLSQLANVAMVGSNVLGSAVNLDKDVMKRLLRDSGLAIPRFLTVRDHERQRVDFAAVTDIVGRPFFVKPCNLGSSVGISKVKTEEEFASALDEAFAYDTKILCEEAIVGREFECAVLGSEQPIVSLPGEIIASADHEFYTYAAKYLDEHGALLEIPGNLSAEVAARMQEMASRAFVATCCEGMARVDFFLRDDREILINELNTIPGFTDASMYPKLMEASGVPLVELLDLLIRDALRRFEVRSRLRSTVGSVNGGISGA